MAAVRRAWDGAVEVEVAPLPSATAGEAGLFRALAYTALVGRPEVGDEVLVSTAAQSLGLGTGGLGFVVAVPARLPEDVPPVGHMVKARYTPLQTVVDGAEECYPVLRDATDVGGMPVVVADLHSALPAVLAGIRASRSDVKVAYVMSDGARCRWPSRGRSPGCARPDGLRRGR